MRAPVSVRPAIAADLDIMLRVRFLAIVSAYTSVAYRISVCDLLGWLYQESRQAERARWVNLLISHQCQLSVAEVDGAIVGFVSAKRYSASNLAMPHIGSLYILPEFQRQGIGTMLMHRATTWLGRHQMIGLEVVEYNKKAIAFYETLGFGLGTQSSTLSLPSRKKIPHLRMTLPRMGASLQKSVESFVDLHRTK